ncbi:MAG: ABC transporter permease [Thermomicrobiales bacterium]|nr:ABC transporter permease [Thermomicrobiales bacterium]
MSFGYLRNNWSRVLDLTIEHIELSALALLVGLLVAIPLTILIVSNTGLRLPVLMGLSAIYTIPSLAFLAFLIPSLGLGRDPAIVVLAAYAQLALVRNFSAGLRGVDAQILEAADGVGMTRTQSFLRVRLPLALPVLIAGLRIATVSTISLATVTAWINAGGLGSLLFDGIARDNPSMILAGTVAIAALALTADLLFRGVEYLTPGARVQRIGRGRTA